MRVGDRTDFNRLRILIETNGAIAPREALEKSIETMIHQLKAVVGFQEDEPMETSSVSSGSAAPSSEDKDVSKVKVEDLDLPTRVASALTDAGIKSAAGLARKTASALKELDGIGDKAIGEIEAALKNLGLSLKGE